MKVKVKVTQLCLTLCNPMDYMVHGILQARILEWVAFPSPGDLPNPEIEPKSPALWVDSPKDIGVGGVSLLQQVFPIPESNRGFLHCRWILYQLSYQGSHFIAIVVLFKSKFHSHSFIFISLAAPGLSCGMHDL